MNAESAQIGAMVQVRRSYKYPQQRGLVGSITKRYGAFDYLALEIRLEDGSTRLFWPDDLKEVKEKTSARSSSWWRMFSIFK
jgi:hypothetical protein